MSAFIMNGIKKKKFLKKYFHERISVPQKLMQEKFQKLVDFDDINKQISNNTTESPVHAVNDGIEFFFKERKRIADVYVRQNKINLASRWSYMPIPTAIPTRYYNIWRQMFANEFLQNKLSNPKNRISLLDHLDDQTVIIKGIVSKAKISVANHIMFVNLLVEKPTLVSYISDIQPDWQHNQKREQKARPFDSHVWININNLDNILDTSMLFTRGDIIFFTAKVNQYHGKVDHHIKGTKFGLTPQRILGAGVQREVNKFAQGRHQHYAELISDYDRRGEWMIKLERKVNGKIKPIINPELVKKNQKEYIINGHELEHLNQ